MNILDSISARRSIKKFTDRPVSREEIEQLALVRDVHDIHTWTITSGYHAMSAHVLLGPDCGVAQAQALLKELRRTIALRYGINHITIQLEGGDEECQESHLPPSPAVTEAPGGVRRGTRR